jgi:hypothetical protein
LTQAHEEVAPSDVEEQFQQFIGHEQRRPRISRSESSNSVKSQVFDELEVENHIQQALIPYQGPVPTVSVFTYDDNRSDLINLMLGNQPCDVHIHREVIVPSMKLSMSKLVRNSSSSILLEDSEDEEEEDYLYLPPAQKSKGFRMPWINNRLEDLLEDVEIEEEEDSSDISDSEDEII